MSVSNSLQNRFNKFTQEIFEESIDEKLTCNKLASEIGISYSVFSKIRVDGIVPNVRSLIKIADYFDVYIEFLIGRTDDKDFVKSNKKETLYSRIDELKDANHLNYFQLSRHFQFVDNYFSELKNKKRIPDLVNLIEIAKYFKVSIDYLLGRTDDKNVKPIEEKNNE